LAQTEDKGKEIKETARRQRNCGADNPGKHEQMTFLSGIKEDTW